MKYLAMLFLLGLLSACATVGNESLNHRRDDWPPMDMTRSQLLAELGPPTSSSFSLINGKSTETLTWSTGHAEMNPALFIPIVGLFVAASGDGMSTSSRALAVTFDDGKLTGRSWTSLQIGDGQQPSIQTTTTVDTR